MSEQSSRNGSASTKPSTSKGGSAHTRKGQWKSRVDRQYTRQVTRRHMRRRGSKSTSLSDTSELHAPVEQDQDSGSNSDREPSKQRHRGFLDRYNDTKWDYTPKHAEVWQKWQRMKKTEALLTKAKELVKTSMDERDRQLHKMMAESRKQLLIHREPLRRDSLQPVHEEVESEEQGLQPPYAGETKPNSDGSLEISPNAATLKDKAEAARQRRFRKLRHASADEESPVWEFVRDDRELTEDQDVQTAEAADDKDESEADYAEAIGMEIKEKILKRLEQKSGKDKATASSAAQINLGQLDVVKDLKDIKKMWSYAKDGINEDQFVKFFHTAHNLEPSKAKTLFQKMDANSDKSLSWDEFISFLHNESSHQWRFSLANGTWNLQETDQLPLDTKNTVRQIVVVPSSDLFGTGGRYILSCEDQTIQLWDSETMRYIGNLQQRYDESKAKANAKVPEPHLPTLVLSDRRRTAPAAQATAHQHSGNNEDGQAEAANHGSERVSRIGPPTTSAGSVSVKVSFVRPDDTQSRSRSPSPGPVMVPSAARERRPSGPGGGQQPHRRGNSKSSAAVPPIALPTQSNAVASRSEASSASTERGHKRMASRQSSSDSKGKGKVPKKPQTARTDSKRKNLLSQQTQSGLQSGAKRTNSQIGAQSIAPTQMFLGGLEYLQRVRACVDQIQKTNALIAYNVKDKHDMYSDYHKPDALPHTCMALDDELCQLLVCSTKRIVSVYGVTGKGLLVDAFYTTNMTSCITSGRDMFPGPGKHIIVLGDTSGHISVYNYQDKSLIDSWEAHPGQIVSQVKLSSELGGLISAGMDGAICLWYQDQNGNWKTSEEAVDRLKGHQRGIHSIAYSVEHKLMLSVGYDQHLKVWERIQAKKDKPQKTIAFTHGIVPGGVVVNDKNNRNQLIVVSADKKIRVYDIRNLSEHNELQVLVDTTVHHPHDRLTAAAFDTQKKALVTAGSKLRVWPVKIAPGNMAQKTSDDTAAHEGVVVLAVMYTQIFQMLISVTVDGSVQLWDVTASAENMNTFGFETEQNPLCAACLDDKGKRLITAGTDGIVCVWNFNNGQCIHTYRQLAAMKGTVALPDYSGGVSPSLLTAGTRAYRPPRLAYSTHSVFDSRKLMKKAMEKELEWTSKEDSALRAKTAGGVRPDLGKLRFASNTEITDIVYLPNSQAMKHPLVAVGIGEVVARFPDPSLTRQHPLLHDNSSESAQTCVVAKEMLVITGGVNGDISVWVRENGQFQSKVRIPATPLRLVSKAKRTAEALVERIDRETKERDDTAKAVEDAVDGAAAAAAIAKMQEQMKSESKNIGETIEETRTVPAISKMLLSRLSESLMVLWVGTDDGSVHAFDTATWTCIHSMFSIVPHAVQGLAVSGRFRRARSAAPQAPAPSQLPGRSASGAKEQGGTRNSAFLLVASLGAGESQSAKIFDVSKLTSSNHSVSLVKDFRPHDKGQVSCVEAVDDLPALRPVTGDRDCFITASDRGEIKFWSLRGDLIGHLGQRQAWPLAVRDRMTQDHRKSAAFGNFSAEQREILAAVKEERPKVEDWLASHPPYEPKHANDQNDADWDFSKPRDRVKTANVEDEKWTDEKEAAFDMYREEFHARTLADVLKDKERRHRESRKKDKTRKNTIASPLARQKSGKGLARARLKTTLVSSPARSASQFSPNSSRLYERAGSRGSRGSPSSSASRKSFFPGSPHSLGPPGSPRGQIRDSILLQEEHVSAETAKEWLLREVRSNDTVQEPKVPAPPDSGSAPRAAGSRSSRLRNTRSEAGGDDRKRVDRHRSLRLILPEVAVG